MMQSVNEKFMTLKGCLKKVYGKTILLVCVVALGIDPLFLFVPVIDSPKFCFTFDKRLGVVVSVLRTVIDTFYLILLYIIRRDGKKIVQSKAIIRKGHSFFRFIVHSSSVLPMPQVAVIFLTHHSDCLVSKVILKWIILSQYIPRIIRIYPLLKEVTKASDTIAETKWVGAAFNLFLYMLHSHVFGAFWYVSAIEKKNKCLRQACAKISECNLTKQFCERGGGNNSHYLKTSCRLIDPDNITDPTEFNFGMYIDALKSGIVEVKPRDFPRKFFYCFWWGLRNISALGQNLKTSNSVGDIVFAIIICICGILLFAVLIGNVQKYLQSTTIRIDEKEEKERDTEKWMTSRMLPDDLKERIRKHENDKWKTTGGIKEDVRIQSLPGEIKLDVERHIGRASTL